MTNPTYTVINGKPVRVGITATGARILPSAAYHDRHQMNVHHGYVRTLKRKDKNAAA